MVRKCLRVGTLVIALLLQSVTLCSAESKKPIESQLSYSIEDTTLANASVQDSAPDQRMSQDELVKQQEQLKKDQEQLEKDQEQLYIDQEELMSHQLQLEIDQEQLKKDQDQLKINQEQLVKEQEKFDTQNKRIKLQSELKESTYLSYLKDLGYYKNVYKNDEKLNIRNAVLLFQSNHNMSVTGKWDEATKNMLINRLLSKDFYYLDNVKAPTKGKWIVVNKTNRTLTLYEDTKVIKKYAVAVGNPSTLTKSGKFIINMKLIDPDWGGGGFSKPIKGGIPQNPLGSRWLGINRTDGSYGIHGTNSFYSIGTYASHGCIRMQNYWVEELFPLVPMKSNVWVGTQTELKKWGITQNAFELQSSGK